mmetsp:Transcript_10154/g.46504  ORF Transcript_10154/g.46504 Transcript_10154/m.46504 type:complete len:202 (+) Transcript_10154:536-1141(+)
MTRLNRERSSARQLYHPRRHPRRRSRRRHARWRRSASTSRRLEPPNRSDRQTTSRESDRGAEACAYDAMIRLQYGPIGYRHPLMFAPRPDISRVQSRSIRRWQTRPRRGSIPASRTTPLFRRDPDLAMAVTSAVHATRSPPIGSQVAETTGTWEVVDSPAAATGKEAVTKAVRRSSTSSVCWREPGTGYHCLLSSPLWMRP